MLSLSLAPDRNGSFLRQNPQKNLRTINIKKFTLVSLYCLFYDRTFASPHELKSRNATTPHPCLPVLPLFSRPLYTAVQYLNILIANYGDRNI
jgi:hypothetical protein